MDSFEKSIQAIDAQTKDAIDKHEKLLAKTIYDSANKSKGSMKAFERQCGSIFKGIDEIGVETDTAFNPGCVVEFREGKSHQVIENWDRIDGVLPKRKVMGQYFVDSGIQEKKENCSNNDLPWESFRCPHFQTSMPEGKCDRCQTRESYYLNISGSRSSHYNTNYRFDNNHKIYTYEKRIDNRVPLVLIGDTTEFEVDNYLNLYHKLSGLYLMFNKTPFPDACFYFAREYTQLPLGKDYYQIFLSKRIVGDIKFRLTPQTYKLIDGRPTLLEELNKMVPDTYERIYELFNNFRKFSLVSNGTTCIEISTESSTNIDVLDPKDRIIEGLRLKLNETISRCENSESIVSDMVDEYNNKSIELETTRKEIGLLEIKIKEIELDYKSDILKTIEETKRTNFGMYKQLNEANVFKAKSEALGISIKTLQKNLEIQSLEKEKLRTTNNSLIAVTKNERDRNKKLKTDNDGLFEQMTILQTNTEQIKIKLDVINKELDVKNKECLNLGEKLSKIGTQSDDVLNNALTDRVDELEECIKRQKEETLAITKQKQQIELEYNKIKQIIGTLKL